MEHGDGDLVLLQQQFEGLLGRDADVVAVLLRVIGQRLLEFGGQAQVIDDEPAGLVAEHAVHAGDGLHQAVPAHRLIDVHRVHARGIEAGEPHVADDDELERVVGLLESLGEFLAGLLRADVLLPGGVVAGRAGHDDLDRTPSSSLSLCQAGRSLMISL